MELDVISFSLGFVVGSFLLALGFLLGKADTGWKITEVFSKETPMEIADIPGSDEYFEKARLSPEDGGHKDPFMSGLETLFPGE